MMMNQHAVVDDSDISRADELLSFETWSNEEYIVGLPLTWLAAPVDQWRILTVYGAGCAVRIGYVVIPVENLNLISPHQEDAAVAAALAFTPHLRRRSPFDVQLTVSEVLPRLDVARPRGYYHCPIFDLPPDWSSIMSRPPRRILTPEENDSVRWRLTGLALGTARARSDYPWLRPPSIMDSPLGIRQHRSIVIANRRPD